MAYRITCITIFLLLFSCVNKVDKKLEEYEHFVKHLEIKQSNNEPINIDSIITIRDSMLLSLGNYELDEEQIDLLNALNTRFEILILNERKKFPMDTVPMFIQKLLGLPDRNIKNITPTNLIDKFHILLRAIKDSKLSRDSLYKVYRFLGRYVVLYTDKLDDSSRIKIEKAIIEIERELH